MTLSPPPSPQPSSSGNSPATPADLDGRRVLLGVCSSIAVYRALDIVSQLVKRGAQVQVVMTAEATELVRPLAFETISRHRVVTSLWERPHAYEMEHLEWTKWAEVMVVAPATANAIGKIAHGIADDALTTAVLAWPGRLLLAPAMNPTMWQSVALQENVARLRDRGVEFVGPVTGSTACGDIGLGRMASVEEILERIVAALKSSPPPPSTPAKTRAAGTSPLCGKRVVITSGPTREFFDPVRFLSNPSSGKMGHALAAEAAARGAVVTLIHGPVSIPPPPCVEEIVAVTTAQEMCDAVMDRAGRTDVAIFAAAVSDWRPAERMEKKQKKEGAGERIEIALVRNPDIALQSLKAMPKKSVRVGFAAETHDHAKNAESKRRAKKFDLLVANNVLGPDGAFGADDNQAWLFSGGAEPRPLRRMAKADLAAELLDEIERLLAARSSKPGRR